MACGQLVKGTVLECHAIENTEAGKVGAVAFWGPALG